MVTSKAAKALVMLSVVAVILGFGQARSLATVKKLPFTLYKERQYKEPLPVVGFRTTGPD